MADALPSFQPQRNLYRQVMDTIGTWIIRGDIPVGSALPNEDDLCARLGVSRTVVREATKVLVAKGMVQSRPRVGTIVRPRHEWQWLDEDVLRWEYEAGPSPEFLRNLIDVRRAIEPSAARLAAQRATDDEIASIREAYQQLALAVEDKERYILADMVFHTSIFAGCHNEILEQFARTITLALRASRKMTVQVPHGSVATLPLHEEVMEAIAGRDADAAFAAMNRIVDWAAQDIERVLRQAAPST